MRNILPNDFLILEKKVIPSFKLDHTGQEFHLNGAPERSRATPPLRPQLSCAPRPLCRTLLISRSFGIPQILCRSSASTSSAHWKVCITESRGVGISRNDPLAPSHDINSAVDNIQTSRLNGFDLYPLVGGREGARRSFESTPEICALDITQRATDGRTCRSPPTTRRSRSFPPSFVRRRRDHVEVLRIFGSFAATTTLNSEISRFVPSSGADNRGQFLDLSYVCTAECGRAGTNKAGN